MTALSIIGFIGICTFALYFTIVAIACSFGEAICSGGVSIGWIFIVFSIALWVFAWWINPFSIHFNIG